MVFVVLRQQSHTMQGLVVVEPELVSKQMVRWVEGVHDESIVLVEGVLQKPKEPIKSCTVSDVELKIRKVSVAVGLSGSRATPADLPISQIHIISEAPATLPFNMNDALRPMDSEEGVNVALDTRLDNRVLDLRVSARSSTLLQVMQ